MDKKAVVPPVNRNLQPAANHKARIQDAQAQGRCKALRRHAANRARLRIARTVANSQMMMPYIGIVASRMAGMMLPAVSAQIAT